METNVSPPGFANPLISSRSLADPWICQHDNTYYLTGTVESEDRLLVWSGPALTHLDSCEPTCIWWADAVGDASAQVWAPELHRLEGRCWVYFTASDGRDEAHRHFVISSEEPLGPYTGPELVDPSNDRYAIDGSVLVWKGALYWLYATYDGLWIAPMISPSRVGSSRLRIATGDQPWEHAWNRIGRGWRRSSTDYWIEAPQPLQHDGRLFVTYSAGHSATPHYAVGLLECTGDVMSVESWTKYPGPVFGPCLGQGDGVMTVGHASFTTSRDKSEHWIVYHGREVARADFGGRTTRMQRFDWIDGLPYFGRPLTSTERQAAPAGEVA